MTWPNSVAKVNASKLAKFGEPITYTPSGGPAAPARAIRQVRQRQEVGAYPQWEEVSLDPASLSAYPVKGDVVTLDNTVNYAVTAVRQPDPYGLTILTLNQRPGQTVPAAL